MKTSGSAARARSILEFFLSAPADVIGPLPSFAAITPATPARPPADKTHRVPHSFNCSSSAGPYSDMPANAIQTTTVINSQAPLRPHHSRSSSLV